MNAVERTSSHSSVPSRAGRVGGDGFLAELHQVLPIMVEIERICENSDIHNQSGSVQTIQEIVHRNKCVEH